MTRYRVTVRIEARATVEVEADDQDAANDIACEEVEGDVPGDWATIKVGPIWSEDVG